MGAAHMPDSFDKSGLALKKAQSRTLHGLIFINLSAEPVAFDHIDEDLADCLRPYDLEKAKVAHRKSYPIAANWTPSKSERVGIHQRCRSAPGSITNPTVITADITR